MVDKGKAGGARDSGLERGAEELGQCRSSGRGRSHSPESPVPSGGKGAPEE